MNGEMNSLDVPRTHTLVKKIKHNLHVQAKECKRSKADYEREKSKFKLRQTGVDMLEKTLVYVQGLGHVDKEADKPSRRGFLGIQRHRTLRRRRL